MLELLLETLKTFDGVEFLIRENKTRRLESYNIKRQPEMRRNVETTRLDLILYVVFDEDGKKYRGSFNTEIHPGTSPGELSAKVEQGIYAAGFVRNEYYPLVMPVAAVPVPAPEAEVDAVRAMADLQAAFYADDDHKDGHISYAEFFITHSEVRILNSNGVDVSYVTRNVFVETAVHWRAGDGKEIEICESYRMSLSADTGAMLRDRVARLFAVAEKKSIAGPTPQVGDINILLTGECLAEFFDYYRSCANAEMVYQQLSTFKEGTVVQGPTGDRLTLTLEPGLEGSSCSRPYDESGLPLDCHTIIRDGTLL
ncbi:MAG: metallopeptidase TldD-related protein, partial [Treponema sp.]|nr:metallopeptidase TldD-related protein [Treponema sp.]